MNNILAGINTPYGAIELQLNPENTYEVILSKGQMTTQLTRNVKSSDLMAVITVIQDNEPRLLQGYNLVVIEE